MLCRTSSHSNSLLATSDSIVWGYTSPTDMMGVEDLQAAWEACPEGCIPLILGGLNINFNEPRDKREEVIRDLLDDINLVDTSRQFTPR